jgi:hypothetical protein
MPETAPHLNRWVVGLASLTHLFNKWKNNNGVTNSELFTPR